jgi:hypothetical protein
MFEGGQKRGDFVFVAGANDSIININDSNRIVLEEETGVNVGGDKKVTEVVVPKTRGATVAVETLSDFENFPRVVGSVATRRKFEVDWSGECTLD